MGIGTQYPTIQEQVNSLEKAKFVETTDSGVDVINIRTITKIAGPDGSIAEVVDGKLRQETNNSDMMQLMLPYLSETVYNKINEYLYEDYTIYEFLLDEILVVSLRISDDGTGRTIEEVESVEFLGTLEDNELLVQENEDAITLE